MPVIPTVIEKTKAGGAAAYDIYSRLLEDRIVFVGGVITDEVANLIIAQILFLEGKDSSKDIQLYINTPGGSVTAGLAIYDTMQYVKPDIVTICVGMAASMGAVLLAGGTKGKRFALPHSEMMLHQILGQVGGQAADIEISARQIIKMRQCLNQILSKHTGQPLKKIEKDTDREFYLNAKEAKAYGLVDNIIEKRP